MGDPLSAGSGGQAWWTTGKTHPAEILNALAYWLRAGCAWRLLPHDLPPWQTVCHYWRRWQPSRRGAPGGQSVEATSGRAF
ncbi:transposase [Streptomyces sp. NPDC002599]|uniref:transposase n=1 Tax=Streptomyces sp. NPDC002599 TaxID=3154421 RepID=UPI003316E64B